MKNNILFFLLLALAVTSCDLGKEPEIEGTNTQAMAGEWWIGLYQDGEHVAGEWLITTSNTAANVGTEMWLIDEEIGVQAKINTEQSAKTLACTDAENLAYSGPGAAPEDYYYPYYYYPIGYEYAVYSSTPEKVTYNGGILTGAAHTPSGTPNVDSIKAEVTYYFHEDIYTVSHVNVDGDSLIVWTKTASGVAADGPYIMAGHRRTGFLEDEH